MATIKRIKYRTPKGIVIEALFLKMPKGWANISIEEGILDKENIIISEEECYNY